MRIPSAVLRQYSIGEIQTITPISVGLIHQTYQIKSSDGMYIFQQLHPVLATKAIAKDFLAVTKYLVSRKFPTPECVLNASGDVLTLHKDQVWRVQTQVPGYTHEEMRTAKMAYESGLIYARFHKEFAEFNYVFKAKKLLHDTRKELDRFEKTLSKYEKTELANEAREELLFVQTELPRQLLPEDLPLRVIHGDPKVSNIRFRRDGRAKAIIDLDTCNRRPILTELGDAFRSWCGKAEDDLKNPFRLSIFRSAWKGYAKGAEGFLTANERKLVPQAIGTITLELAARFLTDYFKDNYFGWDTKRYESRRAHNLARARGQIALYRDLQKKMDRVKQIVA